MKALIIYDSFFGNTEKLAISLTKAFSEEDDVSFVRAENYNPIDMNNVNVLIVGSPTRAFNYTKAIKSFVNGLGGDELEGIDVLAFDTRMDVNASGNSILTFMAGNFGYAAEKIAKKLQKKGGSLLGSVEGFYVDDSEGPLASGEIDRAIEWVRGQLE